MRDVTRDVEALLNRRLPDWKRNGSGTEALAVCPSCNSGNGKERTFSVRLEDGVFTCNRKNNCGHQGGFRQLCELLGEPIPGAEPGLDLSSAPRSRKAASRTSRTPARDAVSQPAKAPEQKPEMTQEELKALARQDASAGRDRLLARGYTEETIARFGLTWTPWSKSLNGTGMVMPYPQGRKIRIFKGDGKSFYAENARGLFGQDLLKADGPVILTAGETDVMAWTQAGFQAVCHATGEKSRIKPEDAEILRGRDVVIAYDRDSSGQDGAETARASLQGIASKVRIARYPNEMGKDASEILSAVGTDEARRIFTAMLQGLDSEPWADDLDLSRLPGYIFQRNGLSVVRSDRNGEPVRKPPFASCPIWPSGDADDVSTGKSFIELSWMDSRGRRLRKWLPNTMKEIVQGLGDLEDSPVTPSNLKPICDLIREASVSIRHDRQRIASRTGWATLEDGSMTFCGPGIEGLNYRGDLRVKGSLEAWSKALDELHDMGDRGFIAWSVIGLSAASPLHRMIGGNNPVMGLIGTNGKGKTTSFLLALSMWAEPSKLLAPEDSTANGSRVHAADHPDLPFACDDLQGLLERNPVAAQSLIYWMGNGQMKKRSGRDGSSQGGEERHGASFYIAEHPITDGMQGGAGRRTIEITGQPMDSQQRSERIEQIARQNAGAPFGALAAYLTEHQETLVRDVRALGAQIAQDPNLRAGDSRTIALALTGVRIVCAVTGKRLPDMDALRAFIVSEAGRHRQTLRDRAQEAWTAMLEAFSSAARAREHDGRVGYRDIPMGWNDDVNPASPDIQAILKAHGEVRALQRDWLARGWIAGDKPNLPRKTIKVSGRPMKVWRPTREGQRAAGLLPEEPERTQEERDTTVPAAVPAAVVTEPHEPEQTPRTGEWPEHVKSKIDRYIGAGVKPGFTFRGVTFNAERIERLHRLIAAGPGGPEAQGLMRDLVQDLSILEQAGVIPRIVPVAS